MNIRNLKGLPKTLSSSGASRDRTGDLLLAKQALYQLSYGPRRLADGRRTGGRF